MDPSNRIEFNGLPVDRRFDAHDSRRSLNHIYNKEEDGTHSSRSFISHIVREIQVLKKIL